MNCIIFIILFHEILCDVYVTRLTEVRVLVQSFLRPLNMGVDIFITIFVTPDMFYEQNVVLVNAI